MGHATHRWCPTQVKTLRYGVISLYLSSASGDGCYSPAAPASYFLPFLGLVCSYDATKVMINLHPYIILVR
jgi:hypothetical protein